MDIEINEVQEIIKNLESSGKLSIKEEKYLKVAKLCLQLAAENAELKATSDDRRMFIMNGVQLGYIKVPTVETDPALETIRIAVSPQEPTPATDRIVAGIKASAIPEGFKLVPEQMYLSDEDIQAICMQCGNGDKKGYGDYEDGILWVGELSNDGEVKYGLNIANANYPEEGSITVFEFDEPLREGAK